MNKIIVTATYIPTSTHDKKKKVTEIFFTETHFFFKNIKAYISMIFFKIIADVTKDSFIFQKYNQTFE